MTNEDEEDPAATPAGDGDSSGGRTTGSPEHLRAVGNVTVSGTELEDMLYRVAEAMDIDDCRRWPARRAADAIKDKVRDDGLPPWAEGVDEQDVRNWCSQAKGLLAERHVVIHSSYHAVAEDGGWVDHRVATSGKTPARPLDVAELDALARRLTTCAYDMGGVIWQGLLPHIAPQVYYPIYGPDAGMAVVVPIDDRTLPERPTPDQLQTWHEAWVARWDAAAPPQDSAPPP